MKKLILLVLASCMSLPVLAQQNTMQPYQMPSDSIPVSKVIQNAEKQGYRVYSVRPIIQQNAYHMMVTDNKNQRLRQSYDMKSGKLLNSVQMNQATGNNAYYGAGYNHRGNHRGHGMMRGGACGAQQGQCPLYN